VPGRCNLGASISKVRRVLRIIAQHFIESRRKVCRVASARTPINQLCVFGKVILGCGEEQRIEAASTLEYKYSNLKYGLQRLVSIDVGRLRTCSGVPPDAVPRLELRVVLIRIWTITHRLHSGRR
jgi:hypothetical protein